MSDVSRRAFLSTGATAAAAGAVFATTGLNSRGLLPEKGNVAADAAADAEAAASVNGPIVVHIDDAKTGKVSIFSGESEVAFHDPQFVARVARATRRNRA
jgi:hypothetical protein